MRKAIEIFGSPAVTQVRCFDPIPPGFRGTSVDFYLTTGTDAVVEGGLIAVGIARTEIDSALAFAQTQNPIISASPNTAGDGREIAVVVARDGTSFSLTPANLRVGIDALPGDIVCVQARTAVAGNLRGVATLNIERDA